MPVDGQRLGVLGGEDLDSSVSFQRAGEIVELAIDLGDDGSVGETRADRFGDI